MPPDSLGNQIALRHQQLLIERGGIQQEAE
jgi:hypothetical protein